MGWAGGSSVFNAAWSRMRDLIPYEQRTDACKALIQALEGRDWDTQEEAVRDDWPEVQEALGWMNCPECDTLVTPEDEGNCWFCAVQNKGDNDE